MFIPEQAIESVVLKLGPVWDNPDDLVAGISEVQPYYLSYTLKAHDDLLQEGERDILLFIALVIYASFQQVANNEQAIPPSFLEEQEDIIWAKFEETRGPFYERLSPFFENTKQEDLLAFIEDTLVHDEDSILTPVGREVIFVMGKTLLDACDEHFS